MVRSKCQSINCDEVAEYINEVKKELKQMKASVVAKTPIAVKFNLQIQHIDYLDILNKGAKAHPFMEFYLI